MKHLTQLFPNLAETENGLDFQVIQMQLKSGHPIKVQGQIITATKSEAGNAEMTFQPCLEIEKIAKSTYPAKEEIYARLKSYDSSFSLREYPNHYPVQILEGSGKTPYNNVFLALPKSSYPQDQLGFEFIDAWANIAEQAVFPVIKEIFDRPSIQLIFEKLNPTILGIIIYWTALAHEWGHMVGPYRVLPPTPHFQKLPQLFQGMMGETAANATAALLTPEHPEIALWILIFHLGYTGRKGYREDPFKGWINLDNDVFSAVFLYQQMIKGGVLEVTSDFKLHLNPEILLPCYRNLRHAIDDLAIWAFSLPEDKCSKAFQNWLEEQIPFDPEGHHFVFPGDLRRLYSQVQMIPEQPFYTPLLPFVVD